MKNKKLIQSVQRAGKILDIVSENKDGISLKEIAVTLGLGSSTVFYLINTLVEIGFIKQSKSNKYKLGSRNLYFGNKYLENLSVYNIALPLLEKILTRFNENIYLMMIENSDFLWLAKLESSHSVKPTKVANDRSNSHATAIGKILLSSFSEEELKNFIKQYDDLQKFTKNTITSFDKLKQDIDGIKENGFALDMEESEKGINCIAVPIYNHKKDIKAAIGISMPTQRFSEKVKDEILPELINTAKSISFELGYKDN